MARVVKCPKCGELGSLQPKKTKHGVYWRVGHYLGLKGKTRKIKWCYIGKELPESIEKQLITQKEQLITQDFTQTNTESNNLKLSSIQQKDYYINSMLTKTSSGTRILMIRLMTRSSASMLMRRLWMRSSHLSHVAVPSPQGLLRTGTRSLFVGRGIGPVIFTPVFSAMVFSSPHTSSSFW
jgi:hypothetical protein